MIEPEHRGGDNSRVKLTEFSTNVIRAIRSIPKGKVATYGQIAALADKEHAARGVAWILHSCSRRYQLPWHRVLGSKGKISFRKDTRNHGLQKKRLVAEGVRFKEDGTVDLSRYQWKKMKKLKAPSGKEKHELSLWLNGRL